MNRPGSRALQGRDGHIGRMLRLVRRGAASPAARRLSRMTAVPGARLGMTGFTPPPAGRRVRDRVDVPNPDVTALVTAARPPGQPDPARPNLLAATGQGTTGTGLPRFLTDALDGGGQGARAVPATPTAPHVVTRQIGVPAAMPLRASVRHSGPAMPRWAQIQRRQPATVEARGLGNSGHAPREGREVQPEPSASGVMIVDRQISFAPRRGSDLAMAPPPAAVAPLPGGRLHRWGPAAPVIDGVPGPERPDLADRRDTSAMPATATLHLDGAVLGQWVIEHLERSLTRSNRGPTGVDPRALPVWGPFTAAF